MRKHPIAALQDADLIFAAVDQIDSIIELEGIAEHLVPLRRVMQRRLGTDVINVCCADPAFLSSGKPADCDLQILPVVLVDQGLLRAGLECLREKLNEAAAEWVSRRVQIGIGLLCILCARASQFPAVCVILHQQPDLLSVKMENRGRCLCGDIHLFRGIQQFFLLCALRADSLAVQGFQNILQDHRASVIISLDSAASDPLQKGDLLRRFHALCQRLYAQHLGHDHDSRDNLPAPVVKMTEESHINFDDIKVVIVERIERRIFVSEIIHPDLIAAVLELVNCCAHADPVAEHDPLRDFNAEQTAGNLHTLHQCLDRVKGIGDLEIIPRQIDGHRNQR